MEDAEKRVKVMSINFVHSWGEHGAMPKDTFVTEQHLADKLVGYVKYKFYIVTMIAVVTTPIACTWMLLESHANVPHHKGAVSLQRFQDFRDNIKSDILELKLDVKQILKYQIRKSADED